MECKLLVKRLSMLSMTALLTLSLAACVEKSDSSKPVSENGEKVLTMGRVTSANPKLPQGDSYEDNAYTRIVNEKLNVKIVDQFEAEGDDYSRQVALAIASGELPDMMRVDSKDELKEMVENDLIEDLTTYFDKNASDYIKEIYESYDGRSLADATFDGQLMAIPASIGDEAPNMIWIRKDWLDKLGIELDTDGNKAITLDELEKTAKAFLENDPGESGNPVGIPFGSWLNAGDYGGSVFAMTAIAEAFDAHPRFWLEDNNGDIIYGSTSTNTKQALGVMADWFEKGIIDPQFGTRTWDDIIALLTNGQTGISTGPWHIADWVLFPVRTMNKDAEFVAYALEDENGKVNVTHNNPTGQFIVVKKGYEHPELAIEILNLFYDKIPNSKDLKTEYPEIEKYGKLGVDGSTRPFSIEVYNSDKLLEEFSYIKQAIDGEIAIDDIPSAGVKIDAQSVKDYLDNPESAETSTWSKYHSRMHGLGMMKKLSEEDKFVWTTPAYFGTTKAMGKKGANLAKLEEEGFIKIVTGTEPLSYFDTFVKNWESQGGDEIIAEIKAELAGN
ncbi:extracellular solute-binding protein [Sporosarcina sp. E16_8]|uniref:extracellular solute-binding protein n=1 Tax=Sporosarcina sp. E16_8 TaxID=2789295 RepID=UPI001A938BF2|nr:extracellular solute-binding protein [Sporosarcina sp. E16_8]MBO0589048.1 extracellular solute-binding protein [Sporosarcina sp. E16_8]